MQPTPSSAKYPHLPNLTPEQQAWVDEHERLHAEADAKFKQRPAAQQSPPEPQIITAAEVEECIRKSK